MGLLARLRAGGSPADWDALVGRIPYARFLGISIMPEGAGRFLTRLAFDEKLIGNPVLPALHGGVIGAFLETAAIFQVLYETEGERLPKPITLTVGYLRSAGPRDTFGRATITKQGRRVASVRVEAWQDDPAKPVAAAQGQFLLASASETE
jgi:uncharacterized protein (TIGR00369 family)